MHLDVSEGRFCVELVKALEVDQVLDAVSIVTNTEAHSSQRIFISFQSLGLSCLRLFNTSDKSGKVWILIVGAGWRTHANRLVF